MGGRGHGGKGKSYENTDKKKLLTIKHIPYMIRVVFSKGAIKMKLYIPVKVLCSIDVPDNATEEQIEELKDEFQGCVTTDAYAFGDGSYLDYETNVDVDEIMTLDELNDDLW